MPDIKTLDNPAQASAQPSSEIVWPDNVLPVSIDIDTGRKFNSVDVDPYQLSTLMTNLGVLEQSQAQLSLIITDRFAKKGLKGTFDDEEGEIRIRPSLASSKTNRWLTHEVQHAADYTNGRPDYFSHIGIRKFIRTVTYLGAVAAPNPLAAAVLLGPTNMMSKISYAASGIIAALDYKTAAYKSDPIERRAFKAERDRKLTHTTISVQ